MVPPRGIEPRSAVYKTAASPQCFKGQQMHKRTGDPLRIPAREGGCTVARPNNSGRSRFQTARGRSRTKSSRRARFRRAPSAAPHGAACPDRQETNGKRQTKAVARKRAIRCGLSVLALDPGHFALLPFGGGSGWPAAAYFGFLNPGSGRFAARCREPPFATHERPQSLSRFKGRAAAVRANEYERIEVIGSSKPCGHESAQVAVWCHKTCK
jgi:hypothetical protein